MPFYSKLLPSCITDNFYYFIIYYQCIFNDLKLKIKMEIVFGFEVVMIVLNCADMKTARIFRSLPADPTKGGSTKLVTRQRRVTDELT